jgi:hypothetical protein
MIASTVGRLAGKALILLAGGLLFTQALDAHKFNVSAALVEHNPREGLFEITIRVFADDLEGVLSERAGHRVVIDKDPKAEKFTFDYIQERFQLRDRHLKLLELEWVGLEVQVNTVYCYVQAKAPKSGLVDMAIRNRLFFDYQDEQVNTVITRDRAHGDPEDLIFQPGSGFKVVLFPKDP